MARTEQEERTEKGETLSAFLGPHGRKSKKQVNVRQSSDRKEYGEATDSEKMIMKKVTVKFTVVIRPLITDCLCCRSGCTKMAKTDDCDELKTSRKSLVNE